MQHKRRKLSVPSPPRDIPKARPRLRVPSPPPVRLPSEREQAKQKKQNGSGAASAPAPPAGNDGFVNLYDPDVSSNNFDNIVIGLGV